MTFSSLPDEAVRAAKRSILDALGVTLAAGKFGKACAAFIEGARESGAGPCRVLGFGFDASPVAAAMANASMSHALDYEDTHDASLVHPHGIAFPAALAVAQLIDSRGGALVDGRTFIAALAAGADISCRLGMVLGDLDAAHGWTMRPLLGTWGATAAAGRLLGLDAPQMVQAFALAFHQVTASSGFLHYPASDVREIRDAFGAQSAVTSALLASRGVQAYDQPFEGPHGLFAMYTHGTAVLAPLLADLGTRFEGSRVSFKPWPSCRGTHAFIEAALAFREGTGCRPGDIVRIDALVSQTFKVLHDPLAQKRRPITAADAKFSIPFTVATALVKGPPGIADFGAEALANPEVLAMADKVHCATERSWSFEDSLRGELRVTMRGGKSWTMSIDKPLGDPARPLPDSALAQKFRDCTSHAVSPPSERVVESLIQAVGRLDRASDLSALRVW